MRVLIIEDEKHLSEAIAFLLKKNHYTVDAVYDGLDGYYGIQSNIYDLVILDVMLPSIDGFEILRRIRQEKNDVSILMLTAKTQIYDKVQGLDLGADDYLAKPFANEELLARLRALMRRKDKPFESSIIMIGDISFDKDRLEIFNGSKRIKLTHLEYELLDLLVSRKNTLTSKEHIITKLWGYDTEAMDNNVEVYVSFLRKKLSFISKKVKIKTTRNVGYGLEVEEHV